MRWERIEDLFYWVSDTGLVKNSYGRILRPRLNGWGYNQACLYHNGSPSYIAVHRLVADAFIPNPNDLPEVNHKDTDKTNNHYTNLEWCNHLYNKKHAVDNGCIPHGEQLPFSKLTDEKVREIRKLSTRLTHKAIARRFGMSRSVISKVISRDLWRHVK
jgi:hypothetical protein